MTGNTPLRVALFCALTMARPALADNAIEARLAAAEALRDAGCHLSGPEAEAFLPGRAAVIEALVRDGLVRQDAEGLTLSAELCGPGDAVSPADAVLAALRLGACALDPDEQARVFDGIGLSPEAASAAIAGLIGDGRAVRAEEGARLRLSATLCFARPEPEGDVRARVLRMFAANGCAMDPLDVVTVADLYDLTRDEVGQEVARLVREKAGAVEDGRFVVAPPLCSPAEAQVPGATPILLGTGPDAALMRAFRAASGCTVAPEGLERLIAIAGLDGALAGERLNALQQGGWLIATETGLTVAPGACTPQADGDFAPAGAEEAAAAMLLVAQTPPELAQEHLAAWFAARGCIINIWDRDRLTADAASFFGPLHDVPPGALIGAGDDFLQWLDSGLDEFGPFLDHDPDSGAVWMTACAPVE